MTTLTLTPGVVTLDDLADIYWNEAAVRLDPACHPAIELAQSRIAKAAAGSDAVYGVNTGFGKLASVKIETKDTATLQRNLILSHCCGVGPAIPRRHARLLMALKLLSLGRGASGVRLEIVQLIEAMLAKGVTPIQAPANMPWGQRTAFFADPEGNIHELFAELPDSADE